MSQNGAKTASTTKQPEHQQPQAGLNLKAQFLIKRANEIAFKELPTLKQIFNQISTSWFYGSSDTDDRFSEAEQLANHLCNSVSDTAPNELQNNLEKLEALLPVLQFNVHRDINRLKGHIEARLVWLESNQIYEQAKPLYMQVKTKWSEWHELNKQSTGESPSPDQVYFQLKAMSNQVGALSNLYTLLEETEAVIRNKAEEELTFRWRIQLGIVAYALVIPGLLAWLIFALSDSWFPGQAIPVIGIPVSVVVWSAIGSFVAILHKYRTSEREELSEVVKWLVARPMTGVIMGALLYLIINAGLFVFGTPSGAESVPADSVTGSNSASVQDYLYWTVAFLGGFSDKFHNSILNSVIGVRGGNAAKEEPTTQSAQTQE